MNEIDTTVLESFYRVLGVVVLCAVAAGSSLASNISKTFEFGEGLPQSRSIVRTFPIPCGLEVAAVVKFRRDGPGTAAGDVPIRIELRKPDTGPDQEGPIAKEQSGLAKTGEQTLILRSAGTTRGCSLPWRVRVQHLSEGAAPFRTYGTIRLDFDDTADIKPMRDGSSQLKKGESTTRIFGTQEGLGPGFVEMTDSWVHSIGGVTQGPNAVKLRFELINPSGTVVKKVEAFSSTESRSELPRFNLIYQITNCSPGQWKVRITNIDPDDDAAEIGPNLKFTPSCPN